MAIRAGGLVFDLGNPFAGIGGGLDLQEIWVGGGGGGGAEVGKKRSHLLGAGRLIYSTPHLKYICFFSLSPS